MPGPFCVSADAGLTSGAMPFSSFQDPADIARSQGALDSVWRRIKPLVDEKDQERERARLVYIVASYALIAVDEDDLAERAWKRYWQR